jgi:hypothetical protein
MRRRQFVLCGAIGFGLVGLLAGAKNAIATVIPITVPDGDFSSDTAAAYINTSRWNVGPGSGQTYTSPFTATLAGWSVVADPSTDNGGQYLSGGWVPYGTVNTITSNPNAGAGANDNGTPDYNHAPALFNAPVSSGNNFNAFIYYPGEQYDQQFGHIVNASNTPITPGPQSGASLTMTTTGISANAVAGATYTATILYANTARVAANGNPSANLELDVLAGSDVIATGSLTGLAQNSPWTTLTVSGTAGSLDAGQPLQLKVVGTNFLEGAGQFQVPEFGVTDATLSETTPVPEPTGAAVLALGSGALLIRRRKPIATRND